MKKIFTFLSLLAAVSMAFSSCIQAGRQSKSGMNPEIKVISYNIRMGVANDGKNSWDYRRPATIAMLQEQEPDIFGVQEAYDFQVDFIAENLPRYRSVGVGREDGKHLGEHMSIFYDTTRISLADWGTYWLSETPSVPSMGWDAACIRTATWTKLRHKDSGKEFFYVNTHLDHVGVLARKNGLALIVNEIGKMNPEKLPMILTGDFNIQPDSDNLVDLDKIMLSARFNAVEKDSCGSYNGWGLNGKSAGAPVLDETSSDYALPIDYIYYYGFSKCLTFKVLNQKYVGVPYISDHYPIASILQF